MISENGWMPYLNEAVREMLEAVRHGDLRAVREILDDDPSAANANWVGGYSLPDYPNFQNECVPLFVTCQGVFDGTNRKGNEYEIARALIDAGADIHVNEDALLSSAAASLGAMGVARALLEAGAPIDGPQDGRREEPLCAALFFGFTELSEYLASQGAMLDMRFAAGLGQLEKVKSYFNDDGSLKPGAGELSMMFWDLHGPVGHVERTREVILRQAMLFASLHARHDVIDYLLAQGADINALVLETDVDATCLHRVCSYTPGKTDSVEAVEARRVHTVKFLLDRGADVTVVDGTHGATAEQWAERAGFKEAAAQLSEYETKHLSEKDS